MRKLLTRWSGVIGLAVVLTSGCSGEPEPKEPVESNSASPEVTTTPPPLPEPATQETTEGAAAFVDYYLQVLNYAKQSGDPAILSDLSAGTCEGCQRFIDTVDSTYSDGGSFGGGTWSVGDVRVEQLVTVWSVSGQVSTTPGYQIPESGADRRESNGTMTSVEFQVLHDGEGWTMMSLSEAAP